MIKSGVDLRNIQPQMAIAYSIAVAIYQLHAGVPCWITAAFDGTHMTNTLHQRDGLCRALDLRTSNVIPEQLQLVYTKLKEALGSQFDVILEKDHIHVEFDPK